MDFFSSLFFFSFSFSVASFILQPPTGAITIAWKEIPWKAVLEHCRTSWILIIAPINRNPSENLVSKSTGQSETLTRGRNRKDSYGTDGTNDWHNAVYEYGQYGQYRLFCSTRRFNGKCNASIVIDKQYTHTHTQAQLKAKLKQQFYIFDEIYHQTHTNTHTHKHSQSHQYKTNTHNILMDRATANYTTYPLLNQKYRMVCLWGHQLVSWRCVNLYHHPDDSDILMLFSGIAMRAPHLIPKRWSSLNLNVRKWMRWFQESGGEGWLSSSVTLPPICVIWVKRRNGGKNIMMKTVECSQCNWFIQIQCLIDIHLLWTDLKSKNNNNTLNENKTQLK